MSFQREPTNPRLREIIAALQTLSSNQSQVTDPKNIHLHYARLVKHLLDCEIVILLLIDPEDSRILLRKALLGEDDWSLADRFQVDLATLQQVFHNQKFVELQYRSTIFTEFPFLDFLKDQPFLNNVLTPIQGQQNLLGIIQAINSHPYPLDPIQLDLLLLISHSFAGALSNHLAIKQLKIDNANLEAWRWELLQSRNTLRSMFDSIPTSIYIIDHMYRIVAINGSRSKRVGQKPNFLVGQICYKALFGREQPCQGCRVNETFLSGKNTNRIDRQWVMDDQVTDWEISTYAILNETDIPVQVIIFEQDVTVEKRLEANLIQSEKMAAVGQLAAGVAHEINNPLSAVIANAQLLRRDLPHDAADALESVGLIETAGLRASQVVRNLLGFSRKEEVEFIQTDLNETILNSLALVKHELVNRAIDLETELDDNLPPIDASRDNLQSVWINMVLNASDSIEHDHGKIAITTKMVDQEFQIIIADNGVGIPPDKASRIFEPFFTTKPPGKGTGLGLSVCHRIIKQHGGSIQVDSRLGAGTKFTIHLPKSIPK